MLAAASVCRLDIPTAADGGSYYSWVPHPGWRFISLDSYDISLLGESIQSKGGSIE